MSLEKARSYVINNITAKGFISVNEISDVLSVSSATARNYLNILDGEGLVVRTHGGAKIRNRMHFEPSLEMSNRAKMQKEKIAKKAASFIDEGDTIILDESTSCVALASYLASVCTTELTVATNSFLVTDLLMPYRHIEVILLGGHVSQRLMCTTGAITIAGIQQIRANKFFFSAHGIEETTGITSSSFNSTAVKQEMMKAASTSYALVDSSKFGKIYISVVCPPKSDITIVVDDGINEEMLLAYKGEGYDIVVAQEES
ncbi:MAG: DeoR/GlpR family DNA-binding transcription regulator [Saccharofermentanales bacterium]|jgi:DeoR/GlpR family transcriptional regulator of sugar metabolism